MMALPPVRPSDCSVVLCKAALPVTFKEGQDRWARTPTGPALTKAPCWLGEGTTGPAATPGPGASTMGPRPAPAHWPRSVSWPRPVQGLGQPHLAG